MSPWASGDSLSPSILNLRGGTATLATGFSTDTLQGQSGLTVNVISDLSVRNTIAAQRIELGGAPSNISGLVSLRAHSQQSDYLFFQDAAAIKSNYLLGLNTGDSTYATVDGLNLYDASHNTMIVRFSNDSVRFYPPIIAPVFDTGGALAGTYNAALYARGSSKESQIQAAINAAAADGIPRVYVPANLYPYSAASINFDTRVQMVREGGNWGVYDILAYGAAGNGVTNDYAAVQAAFFNASTNSNIAFIPQGRFRILSKLSLPSNLEITGAGESAVLFFNWFFVSGATSGGDVYIFNAGAPSGSANTAIRMHDFTIEGDNSSGLPTGSPSPIAASGILFRRGSDIDISRMRIINVPGISLTYQGISNSRFIGNYISGGGHDGITGGSFDTWPCSDNVVANNIIGPIGDDGIAINQTADSAHTGAARPTRISIVANTIFGEISNLSGAAGRGILLNGCEHIAVIGNSIGSTFAKGIYVDQAVAATPSQFLTITGNVIQGAGLTGDGSQAPNGIDIRTTQFSSLIGNVISNGSAAGIAIVGCRNLNVVGNSINSNGKTITSFGIDCSGSTNTQILIASNTIRQNAGAGIFVNFGQNIFVRDNTVVDNGSVGTGALDSGSGVLIQGAGGQAPTVFLTGNYITDTRSTASKTQTYGIRCVSTSSATYYIVANYLSGNSGVGINISGTPNTIQQFANSDLEIAASNVVGWWSPSAFTSGTSIQPGITFASEASLGLFRSAASTLDVSCGTLQVNNALVRAQANSGTLPQWRWWSGSGQHCQFSLGRTANEFSFAVPNGSGAFFSNTRAGDSVILGNSATTLHLGTGGGTPHLSLGTVSNVNQISLNQTRLTSIRTAASLDSTSLIADEMAFQIVAGSVATLAIRSAGTVYYFVSSASTKG